MSADRLGSTPKDFDLRLLSALKLRELVARESIPLAEIYDLLRIRFAEEKTIQYINKHHARKSFLYGVAVGAIEDGIEYWDTQRNYALFALICDCFINRLRTDDVSGNYRVLSEALIKSGTFFPNNSPIGLRRAYNGALRKVQQIPRDMDIYGACLLGVQAAGIEYNKELFFYQPPVETKIQEASLRYQDAFDGLITLP